MADGDEHAGQVQVTGFAVLGVLQAHAGDAHLVAQHFVEGGVPVQADIAVGGLLKQLVLQDLLRAQLVAAVDQVDFLGDVGEVERFLDRGVTTADHADHLVAIEEAVAGGAGGYALAHEGFLGRHAQVLGGGAGGDDQGVAAVGAAVTLEDERLLLQLGGVDVVVDNLGVEALGVLLHPLHQRRAGQAFHVARPVVHFGGGGELAAGLDAGDDDRLEVGARGIDGCGVARRAGTQDDQPRMLDFIHKKDSISLCHIRECMLQWSSRKAASGYATPNPESPAKRWTSSRASLVSAGQSRTIGRSQTLGRAPCAGKDAF
ncbi:hypothetical protein D9M71_248870 [compost metagenome]